eukprot:771222-Amphidinium_carterae.2
MSASTSWLKALTSLTEGIASADRRNHSRQVEHASHTPGIKSSTSLGSPAAFKMRCIAAALACQQLRCNLLRILPSPAFRGQAQTS